MTSTIYTAKHVPSGNNTGSLFALRGLENLAPEEISRLTITGVPLQRQLAYNEYSINIASFLHANATRKRTVVRGFPLGKLKYDKTLPISSPTVNFTLMKALDSDRSKQLVNTLGPGASILKSGNTTIYQAPAVSPRVLDSIIGMCPPHFNCGRDAVNPAGAVAFDFISRVCALFLRTHSYPAFTEESDDTLVEINMLLAGQTGHIAAIRKTKDKEGKETEVAQFDHADHSTTLMDIGKDVMADEDDPEHVKELRSATGRIRTSGNDAVLTAKPCRNALTNIGTRSEAPYLPGVLFPYFHGLIKPDGVFIHKTLLDNFFQLMGGDLQSAQDFANLLKRGCGSLATTEQGMVIAHILKGITLALQTQGRCYVIVESNKYCGFILFGARFVIYDNNKWVVPGSEEELAAAIKQMDPHELAINGLVKKFSELKAAGSFTGDLVTPNVFSEPKNLIPLFSGLKVDEIEEEDIKEIDKFLRGLNYMGDGYWGRNPQMVIEALKLIASEGNIELTRPTYIQSIKVPIHTKEYAALSKFGPESVSFWNERGSEIACKAVEKHNVTQGGKRKAGEQDRYGNLPEKILVSPKPLGTAVLDMGRVMKRGAIKIDLGERAGGHRNMTVVDRDMRQGIWDQLIVIGATSEQKKKAKTDEGAIAGGNDFDELFFNLINGDGGVSLN